LPATGTVVPESEQKPNTSLILSASYTDKGGNNSKALTGSSSIVLRSNKVTFTGKEEMKGFTILTFNSMNYALFPQAEGWFAYDSIDLSDVRSANVAVGWQEAPSIGVDLEARLDSPTGKVIGKGSMPVPGKNAQGGKIHLPLEAITDKRFHKIYFTFKPRPASAPIQIAAVGVEFNAN